MRDPVNIDIMIIILIIIIIIIMDTYLHLSSYEHRALTKKGALIGERSLTAVFGFKRW